MTFATDTLKPNSKRNFYIRVSGARNATSLFTHQGSGFYTYTHPFPAVYAVERNGTALSKVDNVVSNDQWSVDESTGLVEVKLASAPNETTNIIIVKYYLFFTSGVGGYRQDSISTGTERYWEPRVISVGNFSANMKNWAVGVNTLSFNSFVLNNADSYLQQFLTDDDSFANKEVSVWLVFEDTDTYELLAIPTIKALSLTDSKATFSMIDQFDKLREKAFYGDTIDECYARRETGSFTDMNPADHGKPIPLAIGNTTQYDYFDTATSIGSIDYEAIPAIEGICTDYDEKLESATNAYDYNRDWVFCRTLTNNRKTQVIPTATATLSLASNERWYYSPNHNLITGEYVFWYDPTAKAGKVVSGGDFDYSGTTYNLAIRTLSNPLVTPPSDTADYVLLDALPIVYWFDAGVGWIWVPPTYYTYSFDVTSSGNYTVSLSFKSGASGPEYNLGYTETTKGQYAINPATDKIGVVLKLGDEVNHADVAKRIIEGVGLSTKASTFTATATSVDADVAWQIPNIGETEYRESLEYLEDLMSSTLCYMRFNSDAEVEYHPIEAPSTTDEVSGDDYLQKNFKATIDYKDLYSDFIFRNPHIPRKTDSAAETAEEDIQANDLLAGYLHDTTNTLIIEHPLLDISNRQDKIIAARSNPGVQYMLSTATRDLTTALGEDIKLVSVHVPGGEKQLKVTKITKSIDKVDIVADEIRGL